MPSLKTLLTNGWSGWIRITILLLCFAVSTGAFRAEMVTKMEHISEDLKEYKTASRELAKEFRNSINELRKEVYLNKGAKLTWNK